jgi:hypothetical protein
LNSTAGKELGYQYISTLKDCADWQLESDWVWLLGLGLLGALEGIDLFHLKFVL